MKKVFLLILLATLYMTKVQAVKRITKKGVQYEQIGEGTAKAYLTNLADGDVVILETITMGKNELVVVEMGKAYFKKNKGITSVELPRTMMKIGSHAFAGCTKMVKIVLPLGGYDIEDGAFDGCISITDIEGNTIPFAEYKKKVGDMAIQVNIKRSAVPLFSTYANDRLNSKMELWQTKKDYETVEQYKSRVTDENRRKRMDEFVLELKEEFVELYSPKQVNTMLYGNYDPEYEVFPVRTDFFGNVFAKVPKTDANSFRQNYGEVKFKPAFGVQGDTLSIISCQFYFGDKIYSNVTDYTGQGGYDYQFDLPPLDIDLAIAEEKKTQPKRQTVDRTIDQDIPQTKNDNDKMFALIIGNEKYKRVEEVPYANSDARIFAEYCKKTLGIPSQNVKVYQNASLNDMRHGVQTLVNQLSVNKDAKAIVYYAGHGIPSEESRMPYLLPADGYANDVRSGYNLNDLYDELSAAPSQLTMVFLDACFSGARRDGEMLAEGRGVALAVRNTVPTGNILVFSAAQGTETAHSDDSHGHGLFTYYLLKHLHDTKGQTTMNALTDFVIENVRQSSVSLNDGKIQTPTVISSFGLGDNWKEMMMK